MRHFLFQILWFALIVIGIFLLLEITLLFVPNEYSYKRSFIENNKDEIEILILGASHSANCLNPHVISDGAFNAGISGKAYYYDTEMVKRYVPQLSNLKCVIMTISPFQQYRSFRYNNPLDDALGQLESTQRCMHYKYMDISYEETDWIYWSEYINSKLAITSRFYRKDKTNCDEKGYQPWESMARNDNWKYQQLNDPIDFSNPNVYKAYAENLQYMKDMVKVCLRYKVTPIFISVPYYKTAIEHLPQADIDSMYSMISELKEANPNVVYLNYMNDSRFDDEDFRNASHVNNKGAIKLGKIIKKDIQKYLDI